MKLHQILCAITITFASMPLLSGATPPEKPKKKPPVWRIIDMDIGDRYDWNYTTKLSGGLHDVGELKGSGTVIKNPGPRLEVTLSEGKLVDKTPTDPHGTIGKGGIDFDINFVHGMKITAIADFEKVGSVPEPPPLDVTVTTEASVGGVLLFNAKTGKEKFVAKAGGFIVPNQVQRFGTRLLDGSSDSEFAEMDTLSQLFDIVLKMDPISGALDPMVSFSPDTALFDFQFSKSADQFREELMSGFVAVGEGYRLDSDVSFDVDIFNSSESVNVWAARDDFAQVTGIEIPDSGSNQAMLLISSVCLMLCKGTRSRKSVQTA